MDEPGPGERPRERRFLATVVSVSEDTGTGVFELANGRRVEVGGPTGFPARDAPPVRGKAFIVIAQDGQALRWEPYPGSRR